MKTVSVVVPVYYNAASLPPLFEKLTAVCSGFSGLNFEFIFVDDGSGDNSFEVLKSLADSDRRVKILRLSRNFGSNAAILAGMTYASGDCVGFLAADLQDPPEVFGQMISEWLEGKKVILAARRTRDDPWSSRLFAKLFNWLFTWLVFKDFSLAGIGFWLIDRQVANVLIRSREKNAHLIGLVMWSGFERGTVYYDRSAREHGVSKWSFSKKVKYFIDAFAAFSYLPLRLASFFGLVFAGLGFAYALVVLTLRLTGNIDIEGWTALMIVILLTSGLQLLILGILGEYLWRNLDATRQRPLFIVDQAVGFAFDPTIESLQTMGGAPLTPQ